MPKHTRKGIILLFASGFIGVFGSQYLFWLGLAKTPYGTELPSVWLVLIPILTITIGLITKKEAWRKTKIFGLVLSALGLISMLAVYITASDIDNAKIIESNIYFFLHSICKAMNVFIQRSLLQSYNYSPLKMISITLLIGVPFMLLMFVLQNQGLILYPDYGWWNNFEGLSHIIGLLYTVVLAQVSSLAIMAWCISKQRISVVAIYASARPGFIVMIDSLEYSANEFIWTSVFVAVIGIGLLLASIAKRKEKADREQIMIDKEKSEMWVRFKATPRKKGPMKSIRAPFLNHSLSVHEPDRVRSV